MRPARGRALSGVGHGLHEETALAELSAMTRLLSCRDSGRRARQTTDRWRAAVINRRDRAVLERPFGDLVLAGEPDAALRLRIGQEPVEHTHPVAMTRDAVMQRDDHHPVLVGAFLVELVELVLERLLVGARVLLDRLPAPIGVGVETGPGGHPGLLGGAP